MHVCKGSHQFVIYTPGVVHKMADVFTLELVVLSLHSVFVGDRFLQHVSAELLSQVRLRYHAYLALEDVVQPYAISLATSNASKLPTRMTQILILHKENFFQFPS